MAAVDRALTVLRVISRQSAPVTLAELSRDTGYYKSTLLRLLAALEKNALVMRRTDGRYALGSYAHALGRAYEATYRIAAVLNPILADLVEQGSESASFHVYHDNVHRICLLRIDSRHSTLDRIDVGDLLPLAFGAAGKLIRAFRNTGLAPDAANILAVSIGERDPDCAAVAAPVFGAENEFLGAISLSGPKDRFTAKAIKKMSLMVVDAARQASLCMGATWPRKGA